MTVLERINGGIRRSTLTRARRHRLLALCECIAYAELARRPVPNCGTTSSQAGWHYRCVDDAGHEGSHSFVAVRPEAHR